jgi:hypothetical protein
MALAPKKITAWSFSKYSVYKQCPAKAKYLFIEKRKEPPSQALARGAEVHDKADQYIKGKLRVLPAELKSFAGVFKELKAQYKKKINGMVVEDNWAFTKNWEITRWDDWNNCWLRLKLDCASTNDHKILRLRDWKTGKFREELNEEYMEQLSLYGLAALIQLPHIEVVIPSLVYVDQGEVYPTPDNEIQYVRSDLPKLKKLWEKRVKPMLNDTRFAPKPNDKCKWCHFSAAKGGPCKF